ncbi:Dynamitin-domain-containing protein [Favolaschia claudopus]|uniref:Dynamitin-domain-containing protein n=1 Tax=Favolaschia claudopus TaxID=2862362 RepID=A0AAW0DZ24_9AGAR
MSSTKYATLPDIDTAPDVYETEDSFPSAPNASFDSSDDEAAPSRSAIRGGRTADPAASKEELDSTNLMQLDEASKKFRKAEKRRDRPRTHYTYPPSPTDPTSPIEPSTSRPAPLSQRLRALQAEVMALETELADPANPGLFKEREDDSVDPGELIRGLVDVRGKLDKIRQSREGRGRLVGAILHQDDQQEPVSKLSKPTAPAPAEESGKPNVRNIVEMDRRVGELEKLVGSSTAALDESSPLPTPLLPLVTKLQAQLTLLTQPRHIDSVSRRLKLLLSDLDRAAASQHSHRRHTSQSNAAPPSQIQEQVIPLLSRLGPSLPHIPHILTRLRTLSALHTSAAQFESTLQGLEEDHRKMREALGELDTAVKTIETSLEENKVVVKSNVGGLEGRVDILLKRLHSRLIQLRNVPSQLLKSSSPYSSLSVRTDFQLVKELADSVRSDSVQDALVTAGKSEQADKSDLNRNGRRELRKRRLALFHNPKVSTSECLLLRRPPSPESPQPYDIQSENRSNSLFPLPSDGSLPLRMDELSGYIREFNSSHRCKLHIWTRIRGTTQLSNPAIVRFTIRDVLVCYITMAYSPQDPVLVTESVTAFGPREKKSPHSQSDYLVYQHLSQQIAKMLQSQPRVAFQSLINLMCAYEGIFIDRCTSCERVLSAEGHVPPVVRIWVDANKEKHAMFPPLQHAFPELAPARPRMIQVLDFNPDEGEEGAPITVRIHFHSDSSEPIHVRLVVGNKAVSTAVRELGEAEYGRWQLDAAAPALGHLSTTDNKALITVQALNAQNIVLDSAPVGEFAYWEAGVSRLKSSNDVMDSLPAIGRRRAVTHIPPPPSSLYSLPSPSLSDRVPRSKTRQRRREPAKFIKDLSLVRARYHASNDDTLHAHTPILDIVTSLDSLCGGWDEAELQAGRRLVCFHKVQDGCRVILSCKPIRQEDYCEADSVISCIFREETETCYVTSVDIIYLLERLTNDEFPVEEKNRIRRNLEGLRPTTVSKHKPGSEAFFQRIMDFPDPKPRNIEKDLKVFEWGLLGQALEKIMSKYSIYTASPTESTSSLPEESMPQLLPSSMHVPSHLDPGFVGDKDPLAPGLLFQPPNHYAAHHESPLSPALSLYPYGSHTIKHESDSSSGSWASDEHSYPLKDDHAAFDMSAPKYEDGGGSDYDEYDKYMRDEGMISMSF